MHSSACRAGRLFAPALFVLAAATSISVIAAAAHRTPGPQSFVPTQRAHRVFKDCSTCPEMVVVPSGEFMMGSPESEAERLSYESPQHPVKIAAPFAVGRFAVTFDEWDTCVAEGGCKPTTLARAYDEGWGRGRRPVINVSWYDARDYTSWLSRKTGKEYRLLSEAEREYVTRAGTTTPFWWGKSISPDQANYNTASSYGGGKTTPRTMSNSTLPVDSFAPNPWGLYQVHGNIMEWVEDCWHENYEGAPADGSAWVSGDCRFRGTRGGAWWLLAWHLRSAARFYSEPYCCVVPERESDKGANSFRVARRL